MIVSEIKLYELLKAKIGEAEAEAFVEILDKKVDKKFDDKKEILATKQMSKIFDLNCYEPFTSFHLGNFWP